MLPDAVCTFRGSSVTSINLFLPMHPGNQLVGRGAPSHGVGLVQSIFRILEPGVVPQRVLDWLGA